MSQSQPPFSLSLVSSNLIFHCYWFPANSFFIVIGSQQTHFSLLLVSSNLIFHCYWFPATSFFIVIGSKQPPFFVIGSQQPPFYIVIGFQQPPFYIVIDVLSFITQFKKFYLQEGWGNIFWPEYCDFFKQ